MFRNEAGTIVETYTSCLLRVKKVKAGIQSLTAMAGSIPRTHPDVSESAVGPASCRICHEEGGAFISPCECKGTGINVHRACINRWVTQQARAGSIHARECEVCRARLSVRVEHESFLKFFSWSRFAHLLYIALVLRRYVRLKQILIPTAEIELLICVSNAWFFW